MSACKTVFSFFNKIVTSHFVLTLHTCEYHTGSRNKYFSTTLFTLFQLQPTWQSLSKVKWRVMLSDPIFNMRSYASFFFGMFYIIRWFTAENIACMYLFWPHLMIKLRGMRLRIIFLETLGVLLSAPVK